MQAFKLAVGRSQRNVDEADAMPQLPPLSDFVPTPWGRWIVTNTSLNATYVVEVRSPYQKSRLYACACGICWWMLMPLGA